MSQSTTKKKLGMWVEPEFADLFLKAAHDAGIPASSLLLELSHQWLVENGHEVSLPVDPVKRTPFLARRSPSAENFVPTHA